MKKHAALSLDVLARKDAVSAVQQTGASLIGIEYADRGEVQERLARLDAAWQKLQELVDQR